MEHTYLEYDFIPVKEVRGKKTKKHKDKTIKLVFGLTHASLQESTLNFQEFCKLAVKCGHY